MRFRTLVLPAALTGCLMALAGAAEAAKSCKAPVAGPTVRGHPTRATAEVGAVTVWSAKVADRHTLRFANWSNAEDKSFACSKYTTVVGINAWRCRATARPCAYE